MICPQCNNGYLATSMSLKGSILTYRSFSKQVGSNIAKQCSNCLYEATESNKAIDIDCEMCQFKIEVNKMLSGEMNAAQVSAALGKKIKIIGG